MPTVSIAGTDKTFELNDGEIIYDSLAQQGHDLPHGCLSGSCGACKVEVLSGEDQLMPPGVIELNTVESIKEELRQKHGDEFVQNKQIRLSCRAKVLGNITIKPIE
jgi:ferredoxin